METPVTAQSATSEEPTMQVYAIPNNWMYWVAGLSTSVLATQSVQFGSPQQLAYLVLSLLFMWGFVRQ